MAEELLRGPERDADTIERADQMRLLDCGSIVGVMRTLNPRGPQGRLDLPSRAIAVTSGPNSLSRLANAGLDPTISMSGLSQ